MLRGGCALVVFLSHWYLWSDFAPRGTFERWVHELGAGLYEAFVTLTWPTGGHHPAVICFFVLSGFCIHYPYAVRDARGEAPAPWRDYFSRRVRRIMPVYWFASLLGLLFVAAQTWRPSGSPLLELHALWTPAEVAVRFAGMSGLYPREIFAGNYLLNTVSAEIVMYAVYPWFHRAAQRGHWLALGLFFAALQVVAVLLVPVVTPFWIFNSPLMLGLFWWVGAYAAQLYVQRNVRPHGAWFVGAWILFLVSKQIPHFYGLNILRQDFWAVVSTLGILWALHWEARHPEDRDRLGIAALRHTGALSYSLYAVHTAMIMLASWALLTLTSNRDYFVQVGATLAASVAATIFSYRFIERLFYRPKI